MEQCPMEKNPKHVRTSASILAEQKAMHDKPPREVAAAPAASTAIAPAASGDALAQYLDATDDGPPGKLIRFNGKDGVYVAVDDATAVPVDCDYVALCGEVMVGWIKFRDDGSPPDKVMGRLADGFLPPARQSLGDNNQSTWAAGLDGLPQDPWKQQVLLPLQNAETHEVLVFSTLTPTGRRSVNRLLQHFRRTRRAAPDELPVVRLEVGGFKHPDNRVGWVPTPEFRIVGRVKRDGTPAASLPDPDDDMSDQVPF
jgi:hypothetical protein